MFLGVHASTWQAPTPMLAWRILACLIYTLSPVLLTTLLDYFHQDSESIARLASVPCTTHFLTYVYLYTPTLFYVQPNQQSEWHWQAFMLHCVLSTRMYMVMGQFLSLTLRFLKESKGVVYLLHDTMLSSLNCSLWYSEELFYAHMWALNIVSGKSKSPICMKFVSASTTCQF